MKPIQGSLYTVDNSSLYVYVKKVRYVSKTYSVVILEFVTKNKLKPLHTIKNCRLYHDKINHWKKLTKEN